MVSPDGVTPSRMVCVSASVNLPLHHKVHKFSSGTGSPGWSRKKGSKTLVWWCYCCLVAFMLWLRSGYISREALNVYWTIGHARLCVCLSVCLSLAAFPHYCTDLDVTWWNGTGTRPLIAHYWADLQSVHCTGFVAMTTQRRTRNVSE